MGPPNIESSAESLRDRLRCVRIGRWRNRINCQFNVVRFVHGGDGHTNRWAQQAFSVQQAISPPRDNASCQVQSVCSAEAYKGDVGTTSVCDPDALPTS